MALGSIRYWDVSTTALTPPSTGSFSCSTEMEMSRQAPRGRSVCQRLGTQRSPQPCPCRPPRRGPCSPLRGGPSAPGPSPSSPEHHAVPARVGGHAVRHIVVDLHVLVQRLHHLALQQVLVPEVTLPQHPVQHRGRRGLHLRGHLPQAQRVPVPHLTGRGRGQAGCPWDSHSADPPSSFTDGSHGHRAAPEHLLV